MTDSTRGDAVRAFCDARGLTTLVHFTRFENLRGILADGLLSRLDLERLSRRVLVNDTTRTDRGKHTVSLSVGFPNYRMFYKYRMAAPTATWVLLLIKADVLWELRCAFCWANAACSVISGQSFEVLGHPLSLEKMFADKCQLTGISRADCGIPAWYATNPQAEVLALSAVPVSYVTGVCLQNNKAKANFAPPEGSSVPVLLQPDYFDARSDWRIWK